jgi:hypothetical protein
MKQEVYFNIRKWTPVPRAKLNNVIKRKATAKVTITQVCGHKIMEQHLFNLIVPSQASTKDVKKAVFLSRRIYMKNKRFGVSIPFSNTTLRK